jgi:ATP-dependent DNA helicase RecQ
VFGIGTELSEAEWRGVVRQLLAQRLLAVEGDYGTLVLTGSSGDVLSRQRQVMMRREAQPVTPASRTPKPRGATAPAAELPASALPLFERLRAWRANTAREQGVPAYVIFHDATLRQIASGTPSTLADLARVNGVGENKLARYGQQILDLLGS